MSKILISNQLFEKEIKTQVTTLKETIEGAPSGTTFNTVSVSKPEHKPNCLTDELMNKAVEPQQIDHQFDNA